MRQLIKRIISGMGYELRRAPRDPLPFIRKFRRGDLAFEFWIADKMSEGWYTQEKLQTSPEFTALLNLLKPGDRVLEIGSHQGFYAMLMACAVRPTGYVLGLEAVPFNALVAQSQISLNGLGSVCNIRNLAGSDAPGTVLINNDSNAHINVTKSWDTIPVPAETGDRVDLELGPFNVLKIDVEGFEGKVLAGCKRLLARKPKLVIEVHSPFLGAYGSSPEEILRAIDAPSYEGVLIGRRNGESSEQYSERYSEPVPFNLLAVPKGHFNVILSPREKGEQGASG